MLISCDHTCLLVKDYVPSLSMSKRHTAHSSGAASPPPAERQIVFVGACRWWTGIRKI